MNRIHAVRESWQPQSREDRETILRELEGVLTSPHFSNSKRYPALLRYVVENTLAGHTELLKERTLGVEVFQRPATYDTNTDTVVRYTAGEVRKRLMLYYSEHDSRTGIQISLPAGSYLPEFLREAVEQPGAQAEPNHEISGQPSHAGNGATHSLAVTEPWATQALPPAPMLLHPAALPGGNLRLGWWAALAAVLIVAGAGAWWMTRRPVSATTAVQEFWSPLLHDQRTVIICAGSVVFAQNNYSGVITAGGNTDYPFFSMQTTSAITGITGVMERGGASTQLLSAPSTELQSLREHSVILLGAYNNQWSLRLLDPLRYHFSPNPVERIVDAQRPQTYWQRDQSLPYSSADDYAVVARFRDSRIDGWVVGLAGIGRNGTEAAAQFATSDHYLNLLRQRLGGGFGNRNIEAVIKVSVLDAQTGAPTILEVYSW